jgi:hypothetical protein
MKNSNIARTAMMLSGLKPFEEKGLITYDFAKRTALINSAVFDVLLKMTDLNYEKLAKAAAAKIFFENSKGKPADDPYFYTTPIECTLFCSRKGKLHYATFE